MNIFAIKISVAMALLTTAFGVGHHFGAQGVQSDWNLAKIRSSSDTSQAIIAASTRVAEAYRIDIKKSQEVIKYYETELDKKNRIISAERAAADAERLRFNASRHVVCGGAADGAKAAGSGAADDAGEEVSIELPEPIARDLRGLAEDADREVARLSTKVEALQKWAIEHGFYEP